MSGCERIKLGEGWTNEVRSRCADRCANDYGDPPCWSLAGDDRMDGTPEFIEPCEECSPPLTKGLNDD